MKKLILLLAVAFTLRGQDFVAVKETSLSGAAEVVTIQQQASGSATSVRFKSAYVDCSVACTVTLERSGTAASATALTTVPLNSGTAKAKAWSSSNVGSGTVLSKFSLPAGGGVPINLAGIVLSGNGTTKNLTIRTNSITGTVHILISWTEVQ